MRSNALNTVFVCLLLAAPAVLGCTCVFKHLHRGVEMVTCATAVHGDCCTFGMSGACNPQIVCTGGMEVVNSSASGCQWAVQNNCGNAGSCSVIWMTNCT